MNFEIKDEFTKNIGTIEYLVMLISVDGEIGIEFVKNNTQVSRVMFENKGNFGKVLFYKIEKHILSNSTEVVEDTFKLASSFSGKPGKDFLFNFFVKNKSSFNLSKIFELTALVKYIARSNINSGDLVIEIYKDDKIIGVFKGDALNGKFSFKSF